MVDISKARLGRLIGLSIQTEIVFLSIIGIISTMFDASLIDFSGSLYKVWEVKMDPDKFSERVQLYMKYVLTGIVLIRTFTAHIYLGCYILLLYPVLFEERPMLMLPWVVVNAIKCLLTGFVSLAAGVFTCAAYRFAKATCWEFLLTQFVDHAPSVYIFTLVLSYYKDLNTVLRVIQEVDPLELQARRRRTRLIQESRCNSNTSFGDKRDELISVSTIENVMQHFNSKINKGNSRSLDTLLAQMKDDEERNAIMNAKDDVSTENKSVDLQVGQMSSHSAQKSSTKLLLNNWRRSGSFLSSMFNLNEKCQTTLFANPLFEQYTQNVSINRIVAYTSLSTMLNPVWSKKMSLKKVKSDVHPIMSEAEMRTVLPEPVANVDSLENLGKDIGSASEPTGRVEFNTQTSSTKHSSWIQNGDRSKKANRRVNKSNKDILEKKAEAVTEYYKNRASYQSGYRDDGYTQDFFESIDKSRRNGETNSEVQIK